MNATRAVFLDRDGVLNRHVMRDGMAVAPRSLADFELFPEARKACSMLTHQGFLLVVATNQPDVGRGLMERAAVDEMHAILTRTLPIRRVEVSFDPADTPAARRRKPAPGMLLDAAVALGIDLSQSYFIGDSWRDIECGRRAGCKTVYVERGAEQKFRIQPDHRVSNVLEAAECIVHPPVIRHVEEKVWQPVLSR